MIITNDANTSAERFQADHAGHPLTLAGVQFPRPAVSFSGGLVF